MDSTNAQIGSVCYLTPRDLVSRMVSIRGKHNHRS